MVEEASAAVILAANDAGAVRPGEELDLQRLAPVLADLLGWGTDDIEVRQYPAGYSNLTYLLRQGGREAVLRRPPFGAEAGAHDMSREYRILAGLARLDYPAPRPIAYIDDSGLIGAPFYLMERIDGVVLPSPWPPGYALPAGVLRRVSAAVVDGLADLHRLDYGRAGLGDLGRPAGYVRRQVEGWLRRYRAAQTDDVPAMEQAAEWLAARLPLEEEVAASRAPALIHNDFIHHNVAVDPRDPGRLVAVLDWEMATLGDPLMDLGTTLAWWAEPGDPAGVVEFSQPPGDNVRRDEVVARYFVSTGVPGPDPLFFFVYGLVKLAVVNQQIYARFRRGFTTDERFASLAHNVADEAELATRAIRAGRISHLE